jgi:hypothetical protein
MEDAVVIVAGVVTGLTLLLAIAALLRGFVQWLIGINDLGRLLHNNNDLLRRQNELLAKLAGEPTPDPGAATSSPSTSRPQ